MPNVNLYQFAADRRMKKKLLFFQFFARHAKSIKP